jgi:poly-gamma-glutamate synthesis protein (capsule biosynthesis protein)
MNPLKFASILVLSLLLVGCGTEPASTLPSETTIPQVTASPLPSTEPATEPPQETAAPEPTEYVLSFVGDCCLANQKGWSEKEFFIGTVGENYAYPFAGVKEYFTGDDFTFINLENPLTDGNTPMNKPFVFKGPAAYTQILTEGSVEFANVVNNHAMDYREKGYLDTLDALDQANITYCELGDSRIFTTDRGLVIGVHAQMFPQ